MKNKITNDIAFDIDEVMVNFMQPVHELIKNHGYKINEIKSFDITEYTEPKIYEHELQEIFETVYSDPHSVPIYDKAAELCTRLHIKTDDPILFVTDRDPKWATETHTLVKRFCKVPYLIAFNNDHGKLPYLNGISYFVDDRRKTAMELAEMGKTVFIPRRDWNEWMRTDFEYIDSIVYIENIDELLKNINMLVK